jgi:XTP/dITP diphosphohydrolase
MLIYCATSNQGKLREFRHAASLASASASIDIQVLPNLNLVPIPEENGLSFEENAMIKAIHYSLYTQQPVFADDSGLVVDVLDGAPGIHSARFAGPQATDAENNRLLLELLKDFQQPAARFVCVIALAQQGKVLFHVHGQASGQIQATAAGSGGFGYDPVFWSDDLQASFAQVDEAIKFPVSHRGRAFQQLLNRLQSGEWA